MAAVKEISPLKVAIYIRWSTEDQREGTTLEVQRDACSEYILQQGWTINEELFFVDDGHTGANMDRPGLARLREAVRQGKVDCVVVFKIDRLSRSVKDMVNLVIGEWEDVCYLKSAREPIDTTTHAGRMFFYTLTSFAEWERNVIKDRTWLGKVQRAEEGRNPGITPPFGYLWSEAGELVVVPEEAEVVKYIFKLYLGGLGVRSLCWRLNEEGIRNRRGQPWSEPTVKKMLKNQLYCGHLIYGRQAVTGNGKRVLREKPLVVKMDQYPAIIAQADFEAVQAVRKTRPQIGRKGNGSGRSSSSPHLLTGLLRCTCGYTMAGTEQAKKVRYRYYRCMGHTVKGPTVCDGAGIRQDLLDDAVVTAVREFFGTEVARERFVREVVADLESKLRVARIEAEAARKELQVLDDQDRDIRSMLRRKEITPADFRNLRQDLETDLGSAQERLRVNEAAVEQMQAAMGSRTNLESMIRRIDEWEVLTIPERKQILRHFISGIVAHRPQGRPEVTCDIHWRWDKTAAPVPVGDSASTVQFEQAR